MTRFALALLLLTATVASAQTKPRPPKPKQTKTPAKKTVKKAPKVATRAAPGRCPSTRRPAPPSAMPLQIVPAKARLAKRLIFVVDVSGSMASGGRFAQAVQSVLLILGHKTDDQEIAAITFCDDQHRWDGQPECLPHGKLEPCSRRCVPAGWAQVWPETVAELVRWLRKHVRSGSTEPAPALTSAILVPREHVSVVFVSDGEFALPSTIAAVKAAQKKRIEAGFRPATVMVWGAGASAKDQPTLKALAKIGLGGFWVHGEKHSGPW